LLKRVKEAEDSLKGITIFSYSVNILNKVNYKINVNFLVNTLFI